ncbi:HAD-IB family hydrolase [Aliarcobacter trophiarum LMG 25534]|uniref:HAD superfamily hydrolase, subfamily IB n=1 Tax=Aliarcobacter trophiarum LMG 25534 TaxID=1032241 RepID=A0AAD0VNL5_9BACT|nr:HAD-IB family hydrolase [Aliarcobacter trophiarum]AXK49651.1 HAD superfamily hydrolase, subfamily IB [Aliarcobacter trophiarum LMG 25534]RXJ89398.1 HAD-IB family hydrolase [Aliarcobacter trophiarum LMG 25534]
MTLALFDFDGTITTDDSLLKFIRFVVGDVRFIIGLIVLSPILVAYKLKLIPNYKAKQKMLSWFFKGCSQKEFKKVANDYSLKHIDEILRQKAMEKLSWHKKQNHKIVIVSASIECWLYPWCEKNGFELLATKLEIKDDRVTGKLLSKNCYGQEKVNRIKELYDLENFDYIYAYGDSSGDKQMLELAHEKFYKPFRD